MSNAINPTIQSGFTAVLYAQDQASFQASRQMLVGNIQSAMVEDVDDAIRDSLQLLLLIVEGWSFAEPLDGEELGGPPSPETVEHLESAVEFLVMDLADFFKEIRAAMAEYRKFLQSIQLDSQKQELDLAKEQYAHAKAEAAARCQQAVTEGATQVAGGVMGLVGSAVGAVCSFKALQMRAKADKAAEETGKAEGLLASYKTALDTQKAQTKNIEHKLKYDASADEKQRGKWLKELDDIENGYIDSAGKRVTGARVLRQDIEVTEKYVENCRRSQRSFESLCDVYTKASNVFSQATTALSSVFTGGGRVGAAKDGLKADEERAEAQLDQHHISVLDTSAKSFEQFAQLVRQTMVDAVTNLKEMLMSQAQLQEHLGQNV